MAQGSGMNMDILLSLSLSLTSPPLPFFLFLFLFSLWHLISCFFLNRCWIVEDCPQVLAGKSGSLMEDNPHVDSLPSFLLTLKKKIKK